MPALRQIALVVAVGLAGLSACEDDQSPRVEQVPFEGILRFDDRCQVLGGDSTDFLPRPAFDCSTPPFCEWNHALDGACPNPAVGGVALIHFQLSAPDSVWLFVYDRTNSPPIDTLFAQHMERAFHTIGWSNPDAPGIFRIEMHTRSGFRSYGDVEFAP